MLHPERLPAITDSSQPSTTLMYSLTISLPPQSSKFITLSQTPCALQYSQWTSFCSGSLDWQNVPMLDSIGVCLCKSLQLLTTGAILQFQ